jgi:hypothetical protein
MKFNETISRPIVWAPILIIGIILFVSGIVLLVQKNTDDSNVSITPNPTNITSITYPQCPYFQAFEIIDGSLLTPYNVLLSGLSSQYGMLSSIHTTTSDGLSSKIIIQKTYIGINDGIPVFLKTSELDNLSTDGMSSNSISFSFDGKSFAYGRPKSKFKDKVVGRLTVCVDNSETNDLFSGKKQSWLHPSLVDNGRFGQVVRFSREYDPFNFVYASAENDLPLGGSINIFNPNVNFTQTQIRSPNSENGDGFADQFYVPTNNSLIVRQTKNHIVYVFQKNNENTNYIINTLSTPPNYPLSIEFGHDFWISHDLKLLVISAIAYGEDNLSNTGIVFVYNRYSTGETPFEEKRVIRCPDGLFENSKFGYIVTASPDEKLLFISGMIDSDTPQQLGKIYSYDINLKTVDIDAESGPITLSSKDIRLPPTGFGKQFNIGQVEGFENDKGYQIFPVAQNANLANFIVGCS